MSSSGPPSATGLIFAASSAVRCIEMDLPADDVDVDFFLRPPVLPGPVVSQTVFPLDELMGSNNKKEFIKHERLGERIEDAAKRWFPDGSEHLDKRALSHLAGCKLATVKKCIELIGGGGVFPIVKKLEAGEDGKSVQDAVVIFTDENDKVITIRKVERFEKVE